MTTLANTDDQAALRQLRRTPGALCTILQVDGSFSREPGAQLAIGPDMQIAGSLSDGCLEQELANQARLARAANHPVVLRYGAGSPFIDFRLPCGAGINVLVDPSPDREQIELVCRQLDDRRPAALKLPPAGSFGAALRVYEPALRFLIFGSGPELFALERLAASAGFEADVRVAGERGLALARTPEGCSADAYIAIILLFHDHEWEEAILRWALNTDAFYIGSIGGALARRSRLERLVAAGVTPDALNRVRGPVGTIRSTRDPMTLAISILAEVVDEDQKRRRQRLVPQVPVLQRAGVAA